MKIQNLSFVAMGAMNQTIASLFLDEKRYPYEQHPTFNISGWEFTNKYYDPLKKVLLDPELYDEFLKNPDSNSELNNVFFNFGKYKDRIELFHPKSDSDYKDSLRRAIKGSQLIVIGPESGGLEQVCSNIGNSIEPDTYVLSVVKGVIESKKLRSKLNTPYEVMRHYLPRDTKIVVGGGGTLAKEILNYQETFFKIFSDRLTNEEMDTLIQLFTVNHFTAEKGKNRLLNEMIWAAKNPYAIGAGIINQIDGGENLRGRYLSAVAKEMWAIYRKMLLDRPLTRIRLRFIRFARDFLREESISDILTTCYSEKSRNFGTGMYLAQGIPLRDIPPLLGNQVAEGVKNTPKFWNLFEDPENEVPILNGIYEVIEKDKTAKQVYDGIIKLLKEQQKKVILNSTDE